MGHDYATALASSEFDLLYILGKDNPKVPAEQRKTVAASLEPLEQLISQAYDALYREISVLTNKQAFKKTSKDSSQATAHGIYTPIFSTTHSTHAIALTDPPSKLVAELKRLRGIVNAPQR